MTETSEVDLHRLGLEAWAVRDAARLIGATSVGCAVLDDLGRVFVGCNIEHRFRSHDIHAEINAISSLVAGGGSYLRAVFIAAERQRFTPCGGCLDWIFEIGDEITHVFTQSTVDGAIVSHTAGELMPYYPR